MNLEIVVDNEAETINIVLNNHMALTVSRDIDGNIIYSKNFNNIVDDKEYDCLVDICSSLIKYMTT